jgi:hypothetical protein
MGRPNYVCCQLACLIRTTVWAIESLALLISEHQHHLDGVQQRTAPFFNCTIAPLHRSPTAFFYTAALQHFQCAKTVPLHHCIAKALYHCTDAFPHHSTTTIFAALQLYTAAYPHCGNSAAPSHNSAIQNIAPLHRITL